MNEAFRRAATAWMDALTTRVAALEAYVAAIPGADAVDIVPLKEALQKQFAEPYADVLPAEKPIQSAVETVDRIYAKAKGLPGF